MIANEKYLKNNLKALKTPSFSANAVLFFMWYRWSLSTDKFPAILVKKKPNSIKTVFVNTIINSFMSQN
ncbi:MULTISPECIES: hypothetical protein [unclassified Tenacibaculum]|uniref:hypothetical protein n=1 Tax=unclassified Tenacibaculum TaxID=2635139 RepID=UPI001F2FCF8E|nr:MULTISPECIES: hypothetical protein [unclassified Tenacibaculum]MCF2874054.1 hypothetical protein [Tenacibaculum sp. Cn5-1]MCF2934635.1 hypothetical protein [Tenacibaculum sp. Cn5-34]